MPIKEIFKKFLFQLRGYRNNNVISVHASNFPVNLRERDVSEQALNKDAEYAYKIGRGYLTSFSQQGLSLQGLSVLEFGPGINFGTALYLVCHGARVRVADRFLSPWNDNYHLLFYRVFLNYLHEKEPQLNLDSISRVLETGGYPAEVLSLHHSSLEDLSHSNRELYDVTISNAVLEHLYDINKAFCQLSRLTKNGGLGFHQVDHRDHRDFTRPLEYLLLSDKEFEKIFSSCHGECGNRIRPDEMESVFSRHGFEVVARNENITASSDYLDDFYPRLQVAENSRFKNLSKDRLSCISCQYIIKKQAKRRRIA